MVKHNHTPNRGPGKNTKQILLTTLCTSRCIPQNYRWQNGKQYNGKTNRGQSALAGRVRQGFTGQPPPLLHSYIGWLQNSIVKILQNTKLWQNYFEFCKIGGKFCKTRNKKCRENFAKLQKWTFLQPPYSYTICCLLLTLPSCLLKDSSLRRGNAT